MILAKLNQILGSPLRCYPIFHSFNEKKFQQLKTKDNTLYCIYFIQVLA